MPPPLPTEEPVREFADSSGEPWIAKVGEEPGGDYKGRFFLVMEAAGGGESVSLTDVRWNSPKTAHRTLATMSDVELRRRLRSALGRAAPRPLV